VFEPVQDLSGPQESPDGVAADDSLLSRLFGVRRGDGVAVEGTPRTLEVGPAASVTPESVPLRTGTPQTGERRGSDLAPVDPLRDEISERVSGGFRDMSRLLVAIKESLQDRDGQVRQTLQALPDYLQQVPRIQRAQIECMAQISRQLEHMGTGTRDVLARLDGVPDLLRGLVVHQQEQARFLEDLQARTADALDTQAQVLREGLETNRKQAEGQLQMVRSIAATQEDVFATFQNTQNRALNVFHRAQQQAGTQHRETQKVLSKQVEMLVQKVDAAQTRVFWLAIGFAALAAAGFAAVLIFGGT